MNLQKQKENALKDYKEAKKKYLENTSKENWVNFCNKKIICRHLGVII